VLGCAMRTFLLIILTLVCTGCPQRLVSRKVMIAGFTSKALAPGTLAVVNPEVQSALNIIDRVVVSDGFAPTTNANFTVPDSLVTYVKSSADGMLTANGPSVTLKNDSLVVTVAGRGDLPTESKRLLKSIEAALRKEYGSHRVKSSR
jgi:hypothetical protein